MIKRAPQIAILYCCLCFLFFTGYQCNNIIDSTTYSSKYIPNQLNDMRYWKDTLFLFRPVEGSHIDFYGTRSCTTIVKPAGSAATDTQTTDDSLFIRFTTGRDTFLLTSDSLEGEAKFQPNDIPTLVHWDNILTKFPTDTLEHLMAFVMDDFLDPIQVDSFMLIDSAYKLTKSNKSLFVNALNSAVNTDTLFFHYSSEMYMAFASDTNFSLDVKRLISDNIFIDTSGTVNSALSFIQKETLKRFNFRIFTRYFNNNIDYPMFSKHPVNGRVFMETVEKGRSPLQITEKMTRFFKVTDKNMFQLSFLDRNNMVKPKNTKVGSYFTVTDIVWDITPLVFCSDVPIVPLNQAANVLQPGKAILRFDSLVVTHVNRKHYTLEILYPLLGNATLEDGKAYTIYGMITVTAWIYNNSSIDITLIEPDHDVCYYAGMNYDINVCAKNALGKEIMLREKRVLINDNTFN